MKCYSVFYLIPAVALFAGMAQLRAGWLGAAPKAPEPAAVRPAESASWAIRPNAPPPVALFLRQR